MNYFSDSADKSMVVLDNYLAKRLSTLTGKDRAAMVLEFKEWLIEKNIEGDEIWTIPDLTDDGLCDFFKRAISRK